MVQNKNKNGPDSEMNENQVVVVNTMDKLSQPTLADAGTASETLIQH